jgi:hypothetical protein
VEPIQYPYSRKFSTFAVLVVLALMLFLLNSAATNKFIFAWVIYSFIALVLISLGTVLVVKRFAPALRGDVALQLDDEGISDYIKDVSIKWDDIEAIRLSAGPGSAIIVVHLKWESDFGSQVAIYLRWVQGNDKEIYSTMLHYFEQYSG